MFDVAVIGRSLTGSLAAIALRERGLSVFVAYYAYDNQGLERMIDVPPTALNGRVVDGLEFAERFHARAEALDISAYAFASTLEAHDGMFSLGWDEEKTIQAKAVVFAPAGSEPPVDRNDFYEILGRGISMDAWSDAPFARRAAVVGCRFRAAEEALVCVRSGVRDILIVCDDEPSFGSLSARVASANIQVSAHAHIGEIHVDALPQLEAFEVVERGHSRREERNMIFLARGPECDWTIVEPHRSHPRLVVAGLANGIPNGDYPAMVTDAVRAADAVTRAL